MDNECSCPSLKEIRIAFRPNITVLFLETPHLKETRCLSDFLFERHKLYSLLSQTLYPSRGLQSTALTSSFYLNITVTFISYSIRYDSHRSLLKLKLELRKPTKHTVAGSCCCIWRHIDLRSLGLSRCWVRWSRHLIVVCCSPSPSGFNGCIYFCVWTSRRNVTARSATESNRTRLRSPPLSLQLYAD